MKAPTHAAASGRRALQALLLLAGAWACVWLLHYPLLHLPYYWDEAGYYIPSAYDFFRSGTLIPYSTLSNAHPPIPSILLAAFWKAFGFHIFVTRSLMCLMSAISLLAVWRIAISAGCARSVAAFTVVLTAIYPVFFAQSSLAHADMFAAPATLWAIAFLVEERHWASVFCFSLAALAKETSIATPAAIAGWEILQAWWQRRRGLDSWPPHANRGFKFFVPAIPLVAWYAWYYSRTGYVFGNPQYFQYNAEGTLNPERFFIALFHRTLQVTLHMQLFVPFLLALSMVLLPPVLRADGTPRESIQWKDRAYFSVIIIGNVIFFAVFGGALLTRYLLPVYPLVILLCINSLWRRLPLWHYVAAFSVMAFILGLFINPPYQFAPEDNLEYVSFIHLQQEAIRQIQQNYPHQTVLTAWPASDELTKPMLGYVKQPIPVIAIRDFDLKQIHRAATTPGRYGVALVFSTKYDPPHMLLNLGSWNNHIDKRFFDFHKDLMPKDIANQLGGAVVWEKHEKGEWAAIIDFNLPASAKFAPRKPPGSL
ncbi:MAG: ArnT family glycosyltransferase [Acidobacteriaceae bacterium]